MNRHERLRHLQWEIAAMYVDHELLGEEYWDEGRGARWLIGRPGTNVMRTEIIAGVCGSLLVHGDCDLSRFAHYSDHRDAWNRLLWMGCCRDVGYYVAQKYSIGMARSGAGSESYDEDVAKHDLRERIAEELRCGREPDDPMLVVLEDALESHTESKHELRTFLSENDKGWDFWEWRIGEVTSTSVVTGHLALQRCAYLLADKHGWGGPPACRGVEPA